MSGSLSSLTRGQVHVLHAQGVEHVPEDGLFIGCQVPARFFLENRKNIDNLFRLRQVDGGGRLLGVRMLRHQHQRGRPERVDEGGE